MCISKTTLSGTTPRLHLVGHTNWGDRTYKSGMTVYECHLEMDDNNRQINVRPWLLFQRGRIPVLCLTDVLKMFIMLPRADGGSNYKEALKHHTLFSFILIPLDDLTHGHHLVWSRGAPPVGDYGGESLKGLTKLSFKVADDTHNRPPLHGKKYAAKSVLLGPGPPTSPWLVLLATGVGGGSLAQR